MTWITPITLTGRHVQLEPYEEAHLPDLWTVGQPAEIWRYMPFPVRTEQEFHDLIRGIMDWPAKEFGLGFAQRALPSGELVGGTTYLNADETNRRVEIGTTWLTPAWQRTAVNTEAKLLLLDHAFASLGCIRVEFKTDSLNERSRAALTRIGAVEEGTLRNHMIMPDGRFRHSTYFSITGDEWPAVRDQLSSRLARG